MARKKTNSSMSLTTGVGYITVRTTIRRRNTSTTYKTKFGFCGAFVPSDLKKLAADLKNICYKDVYKREANADSIITAARIYYSECEYILPNNKTTNS